MGFWYGSDKTVGLKEIMRREEAENRANGESKIMPLPIMTEEEMMNIIKRQKNGKAAGIDGIKAETMKFMTRNKKIRRGLLNAFNKKTDRQTVREKEKERNLDRDGDTQTDRAH